MLRSAGDDREAWLRTGQALQRVLLVATVHGLATQPMTQALEMSDLRRTIGGRPAPGWYLQMILRIGYGVPVGVSPGRPVSAVLTRAQRPHDQDADGAVGPRHGAVATS